MLQVKVILIQPFSLPAWIHVLWLERSSRAPRTGLPSISLAWTFKSITTLLFLATCPVMMIYVRQLPVFYWILLTSTSQYLSISQKIPPDPPKMRSSGISTTQTEADSRRLCHHSGVHGSPFETGQPGCVSYSGDANERRRLPVALFVLWLLLGYVLG